MDVVRLNKVNEVFRVLYDVKGRYILHELKDPKEAGMKLCRVAAVSTAKKATIGHNPFQAGQAGAIPYLSTHDGRTIRYPDPLIKKGDTVQVDIKTGKVSTLPLPFIRLPPSSLPPATYRYCSHPSIHPSTAPLLQCISETARLGSGHCTELSEAARGFWWLCPALL